MAEKFVYVRPSMTTWRELRVRKEPGRKINPMDNSIGFLPAFDTFEEFQAAYPGETPLVLRLKEQADDESN